MHGRADRSHLPRLGPTIFAVTDCLFCAIVAGEIPATLVVETDRVLAFRDINPQAPIHVVVISKTHYPDVAALAAADDALLGELLRQAHHAATAEGIGTSGYRVVFNTGAHAGQEVPHVHAHLLGGRSLTWPPG
jgi:histidine triad (HIT) family protein